MSRLSPAPTVATAACTLFPDDALPGWLTEHYHLELTTRRPPFWGLFGGRTEEAVKMLCRRCGEAWSFPTGRKLEGEAARKLIEHAARHGT